MSPELEAEDFLPAPTSEEREAALKAVQTSEPWHNLYLGASELARRRIVIAYLIAHYAGKRNMWPTREERDRVEAKMTTTDFAYLATAWYSEAGKEHFRDLYLQARLRSVRTTEGFRRIVAGQPEADRKIIFQTMDAVLEVEDPACVSRDMVWDATCGSASAQALLGDCFLHEHDVIRNVDIAAFWLRKAAPGNETARKQFAELVSEGLA